MRTLHLLAALSSLTASCSSPADDLPSRLQSFPHCPHGFWLTDGLTYAIVDPPERPEPAAALDAAWTSAVAWWTAQSRAYDAQYPYPEEDPFPVVPSPDDRFAHIEVSAGPFDAPLTIMLYNKPTEVTSGLCLFRKAVVLMPETMDLPDRTRSAAREIGHALGLADEPSDPTSVMYPGPPSGAYVLTETDWLLSVSGL